MNYCSDNGEMFRLNNMLLQQQNLVLSMYHFIVDWAEKIKGAQQMVVFSIFSGTGVSSWKRQLNFLECLNIPWHNGIVKQVWWRWWLVHTGTKYYTKNDNAVVAAIGDGSAIGWIVMNDCIYYTWL